jgi:hypothetical protein
MLYALERAVATLTLLTLHLILLSTGFRNWPVLISSPFKRRSVFFFSSRSTPSEISSVNTTSPRRWSQISIAVLECLSALMHTIFGFVFTFLASVVRGELYFGFMKGSR